MSRKEFFEWLYREQLVERYISKFILRYEPTVRQDIAQELYLQLLEDIDDDKYRELDSQQPDHKALTAYIRQSVIWSVSPTGKLRKLIGYFDDLKQKTNLDFNKI